VVNKDEALKMALEALDSKYIVGCSEWRGQQLKALTAIKAALAQSAQEPDRQALQANGTHPAPCARHCEAQAFKVEIRNLKAQLAQPAQEFVAWEQFYPDMGKPQRPWVGLTDDEIKKVIAEVSQIPPIDFTSTTYGRAIEAKLKEKNT